MALSNFNLDLIRIEEEAYKKPDDLMSVYVQKLVNRVRELDHELNHPNFMYAHDRVPRSALIHRNMEIEKLKEQVKQLTKELEEERKITKLPCHKAKLGWRCTRGEGHSGPCAAVRIEQSDKTDLHDRD